MGKCKLPRTCQNVYTVCHQCPEIHGSPVFPSGKQCRDTLANSSDESSTGPQRCPLDCTIVEGCRTLAAPNDRNTHQPHSCLSTKSVRLHEKVEVRGTRWPTSRCLGLLRSTDARKLLSTARMSLVRLLEKLRCEGVHPASVDLEGSWLQQRSAQVVVEGQRSDKILLRNMVFQGTVLGPTLWNFFYEDAWRAIHEAGFVEIVCADDLNGIREFEHNASVDSVMSEAKKCQTELHKWSKENQVSFDPAKESVHIVSHTQPHGDSFQLLVVTFDCKLRMDLCVCGRR